MSGGTHSFLSFTSPAMQAALGIWRARSATADDYDEYDHDYEEDNADYERNEEDQAKADADARDGKMNEKDRDRGRPAHVREKDRKEEGDARPHTLRPKI